ncbi:protein D2-like [Leguminivora glycinivorella]|uniref:protein D2-like n=1 Tax=Leguminivora glycinivorella TaxID=1035111 RepID=UPI00200FEE16|nr:protein D2-like [Leguminivora glycinivorella]
MFRILIYSFICLVAGNGNVSTKECSSVRKVFIKSRIVPDVIPVPPKDLACVKYPNVIVNKGNAINPLEAQVPPNITWKADPHKYYIVFLVDPDAPSPELPIFRLFNHWIVGNIPGNNVAAGEDLTFYVGPTPPPVPVTAFHRYVFLVYKQPKKLNFGSPLILSLSRLKFSLEKFVKKFCLGTPIAGNFFRSRLIDAIPLL